MHTHGGSGATPNSIRRPVRTQISGLSCWSKNGNTWLGGRSMAITGVLRSYSLANQSCCRSKCRFVGRFGPRPSRFSLKDLGFHSTRDIHSRIHHGFLCWLWPSPMPTTGHLSIPARLGRFWLAAPSAACALSPIQAQPDAADAGGETGKVRLRNSLAARTCSRAGCSIIRVTTMSSPS